MLSIAFDILRYFNNFGKKFTFKLLNLIFLCNDKQISYNVNHRDTHKNGWKEERKNEHSPEFMRNYYVLMLYYETFDVEEHVESLAYNAGSFLVSVGGNLGLFLGFSCLSILFALINILKENWMWCRKV